MPVRAWVLVTSKSRWNFVYYFQILVTTDRHDANWELHYNQRPGREQRWEISSKDPALQQHLSQSGLLGIIPGWDHDALIQYNGRKGTLLYRHHIFTRDGLPTPDVFEMQLGMLKKVATINSRANQGSDSIIQYNQQ